MKNLLVASLVVAGVGALAYGIQKAHKKAVKNATK